MSASTTSISDVLFSAEDIEASFQDKCHRLNTSSKGRGTSLGDRVGIKDQGVHLIDLEPGQESVALHYHLQESEWMYILSGSGFLLQVDSSAPPMSNKASHPASEDPAGAFHFLPCASTSAADPSGPYEVKRHPVKAGDFIGFPAGVQAAKWGHSAQAGEEGMRYLCGGLRVANDVCVYPLAGRAVSFQNDSDGKKVMVLVKPQE